MGVSSGSGYGGPRRALLGGGKGREPFPGTKHAGGRAPVRPDARHQGRHAGAIVGSGLIWTGRREEKTNDLPVFPSSCEPLRGKSGHYPIVLVVKPAITALASASGDQATDSPRTSAPG